MQQIDGAIGLLALGVHALDITSRRRSRERGNRTMAARHDYPRAEEFRPSRQVRRKIERARAKAKRETLASQGAKG
jgi:hypothetical protein